MKYFQVGQFSQPHDSLEPETGRLLAELTAATESSDRLLVALNEIQSYSNPKPGVLIHFQVGDDGDDLDTVTGTFPRRSCCTTSATAAAACGPSPTICCSSISSRGRTAGEPFCQVSSSG